ncbi:thioesterase II family protein [Ascidiimonas aurantiaca]|uniref:thioesterase II family protein n=1 Tax=Ascidiimonas aurantiaca TaxID=1685432 RepID=UPI0030ECCE7A
MKKPKLFLLHFAGGNRYSFDFLVPYLTNFEVISLELPGRGKRIREDLITEFDIAAADIYKQITQRLDHESYMLFGHSMGAYMAFKVCSMLEKEGIPPSCLFVSGNAGPGIYADRKRYLYDREKFIEVLKDLGGLPQEVLENDELLDFVIPVLRADFELAERNNLNEYPPVNTPVFAMMGDQEEKSGAINNWKRFTTANFQSEILPGGHFFLNDAPQKVAQLIEDQFKKIALFQQT